MVEDFDQRSDLNQDHDSEYGSDQHYPTQTYAEIPVQQVHFAEDDAELESTLVEYHHQGHNIDSEGHIVVCNPTQMETLEDIQAKINQEIRSRHVPASEVENPAENEVKTPVENVVENPAEKLSEKDAQTEKVAEKSDDDGDLVIDEPELLEIAKTASTSSTFSVPKSPVEPKKKYPSGPYIETDSDASPTKPKHVRISTSSEDSVFFPTSLKKSILKKTEPVKPEKPVSPHSPLMPTNRIYDSSEEEMDSDFDDMPDLEETPTEDSFIDDLPQLEELPQLPVKPRKRKSLPTQPPPAMSKVKRHRRGIRRTKSAVESYVNQKLIK